MLSREPEDVIISRAGSVLGKKTVIKSDHFPGCQNKRLLPHVEGAPNYRQVDNLPVFGVAIPTVEGIRNVLHLVGCSKHGGRPVLWHNMREEPVIYINGRPFVLREVERPFTNVEYTGIDRARLEQMEMRLKEDILDESKRFSNKIMVSDELPDGQMVDQWEPIGPDSAQTPLEVYESLQAEGYPVKYERVPVTDEKSPKERDFDLLVANLSKAGGDVAQLFNCQMGRGRTTTGMIVATLLHLRRNSTGLPSQASGVELADDKPLEPPDVEEELRRGEYPVIRSLTRVLKGGAESKRQVDAVINQCSAMQNLREAILSYRNAIQRQPDEKKRQAALTNFQEYLERYYFLICFAVFLRTDPQALEARVPGQTTGGFQNWMKQRPELYSVLRKLLRSDPMGALSVGRTLPGQIRSKPPVGNDAGMASLGIGQVVGARNGEVLGKQTCLKSDHCPGLQSLPEIVDGAPNFRTVSNFVYGVANPTVDGIRAVLARVGGGKPTRRKVVWHNMREEAMVYINGKPFVLRELERPFKNFLEYTGIERARVEQMEARLKEDVLREAALYEGKIMVNDENDEGQIYEDWENVLLSPTSVQTPLEVYAGLQAEGYDVEYARVPITDGKAPKSRDFDALAQRIAAAGPGCAFVFNCQMGRGRTTTGTVIATLVLSRCLYGRPLLPFYSSLSPEQEEGEEEEGDEDAENDSSSDTESPKQVGVGKPRVILGKRPREPHPTDGNRRTASASDLCETDIGSAENSAQDASAGAGAATPMRVTFKSPSDDDMATGANGEGEHGQSDVMDEGKEEGRLLVSALHSSRLEHLSVNSDGDNPSLPHVDSMVSYASSGMLGTVESFNELHGGSRSSSMRDLDAGNLEGEGYRDEFSGNGRRAGRHIAGKDRRLSDYKDPAKRKLMMKFTMEDIAIIRKITRLLTRGEEVRTVLDAVIDKCAAMQNIRQAILHYRRRFNNQDLDARVRQSALSRGVEYLERYFMLIAFTAYLESDAFDPGALWPNRQQPAVPSGDPSASPVLTFKAWLRRRPEIRQMKWSMKLRPARVFAIPEEDMRSSTGAEGREDDTEGAVQEAIVRSRVGSVLGRSTILKLSVFPGIQHSGNCGLTFEGAPNVCSVNGFSVYSMATPSVEGAREVLSYLGARSSTKATVSGNVAGSRTTRTAIVTDLREEALVYIKGKAYVLREMGQPVAMLNHVGIEGPMVEALEQRLKEDILEEAARLGGRILLHHEETMPESPDSGPRASQTEIIGTWVSVEPEDVATPVEVYRSLAAEGLLVDYRRVPLTRERAPRALDVDQIQRRMDEAPKDAVYLFVSHTGYGGVAYAMAITCIRLHTEAQAAQQAAKQAASLAGNVLSTSTLPPQSLSLSSSPSQSPRGSMPPPSTNGKSPMTTDGSLGSPTSPKIVVARGSPFSQHLVTPPSPRTSVRGFYASGIGSASDNPQPKKVKGDEQEELLRKGEYRDILSLERVLVYGPAAKFEADAIIDRLTDAGRLRDDILDHKRAMEAFGEGEEEKEKKAGEAESGLKALRRYWYLIVFCAYLYARQAERGSLHAGPQGFAAWMAARPELGHLVEHLKLV
eukprot:TRINITY_DN8584_c2_g1_i1.p1 TRINITY_DN8584_c2_g1~~TRINITY_DN8584_c2_g1_i1.p1  ORF type:complete len:1580 (+),score=309.80 TRINITY_DN8584_c2_g1_i1:485-5224(+)